MVAVAVMVAILLNSGGGWRESKPVAYYGILEWEGVSWVLFPDLRLISVFHIKQ